MARSRLYLLKYFATNACEPKESRLGDFEYPECENLIPELITNDLGSLKNLGEF